MLSLLLTLLLATLVEFREFQKCSRDFELGISEHLYYISF